ncbi:ETX/MTX2 family pore-forming toxin, partial [Bacillus cereus]|uniref:ETX/MTX2 family pore-forming toxin n=1 Tax=Bacillus cereus TaxID=1396 RepID=UPI000BFAC9F0
ACMLGTGIFTLPNATHAAATTPNTEITSWDEWNSDKWKYTREAYGATATPKSIAAVLGRSGINISGHPTIRQKFNLKEYEFVDYSGYYTNSNSSYQDQIENKLELEFLGTSPAVKLGKVQLKDQGNIILGDYSNHTSVNQTRTTPVKSYEYTETFNFSQQAGFKMTVGASVKVKAGIPGLAEGEVTGSVSQEFSASASYGKTYSEKKTITYPSQQIILQPNGKTQYYSNVKQAEFNGSLEADSAIKDIQVTLPIASRENHRGYREFDEGARREVYKVLRYETVTLTSKDLYELIVSFGNDIPPYLKLDHKNRDVLARTTFNYEGQSGFYETAYIKFEPFQQVQAQTQGQPEAQTQAEIMTFTEYMEKMKTK